MEPEDVFQNPPVYKHDQVITEADLDEFIKMLYEHYKTTNPVFILERYGLETALRTAQTLKDWIEAKKNFPLGWEE